MIRTILRQTIGQTIKSPPPPKRKNRIFPLNPEKFNLFPNFLYQYAKNSLTVKVAIGSFGVSGFLWAQNKATAAIKDAYNQGMFDINTVNLRDWIIETNPTQEDICNAFVLAIENNHPQTVNFLLKNYSFSQRELESFFISAIHNKRTDCLGFILESKNFYPINSTIEKEALDFMLENDLGDCLEIFIEKVGKEKLSRDFLIRATIYFAKQSGLKTSKTSDILLRDIKKAFVLCKQLPSEIKDKMLSIIESLESMYHFTNNVISGMAYLKKNLADPIADFYLEMFRIVADSANETLPKTAEELLLILQQNMESTEKKVLDLINSVTSCSTDSIKNTANDFTDSFKKIDLTPSDTIKIVLNNILNGTTKHNETSILLGEVLGKKTIDLLQNIHLLQESLKRPARVETPSKTSDIQEDAEEIYDIESALLEMMKNDTESTEANKSLSAQEKMQSMIQQIESLASPKCLAVLKKYKCLQIDSIDDIREAMKYAASFNNLDYLEAILKIPSAKYLQEQDFKAILTQAISAGSIESVKCLLSQKPLLDQTIGELLVLSAKEGRSEIVSLFLLFGNRICQEHLFEGLLEAVKGPSPSLSYKILECPYLIKDEAVISSFFTELVRKNHSYCLDPFFASSDANLISPETLYAFLKDCLTTNQLDLVNKIIDYPVFSKLSTEQNNFIVQSLERLKKASQESNQQELKSPFANKDYARKALVDLCAHSNSDSVEQLLKMKEYSTIPLEIFLEAIDSAKSNYREENIQVLLQSTAYKNLNQQHYEKVKRADIPSSWQKKALASSFSIQQTISSSVYCIWQSFQHPIKNLNLTPASNKENEVD